MLHHLLQLLCLHCGRCCGGRGLHGADLVLQKLNATQQVSDVVHCFMLRGLLCLLLLGRILCMKLLGLQLSLH